MRPNALLGRPSASRGPPTDTSTTREVLHHQALAKSVTSSPVPLAHTVFLSQRATCRLLLCYYTYYFLLHKKLVPPFTALEILLIVQDSLSLASLLSIVSLT